MGGTLAQQAALAVNPGFLTRVQAAMITGAAAQLATANDTQHPISYAKKMALGTAVIQNPTPTNPYISQFAWAVVTTTGTFTVGSTLTPIASTAVGPPAAITTAVAHGLSTGNTVTISGATDPLLNATWTITVTSTTAFTVPITGSLVGGASGSVSLQPLDSEINTAIASVWNYIAGITPINATT